ncbi:hypothetical protein ACWDAO_19585 [Streptomyces sp. NPDC001212]|uniref:hypothetical protein n=1 Tax=Streptomyces sp. CoT10 TaxID=2875762 RepID=UPI001CD5E8BA|nr:hypothetical protein [Streptomyces sp. CoT10]
MSAIYALIRSDGRLEFRDGVPEQMHRDTDPHHGRPASFTIQRASWGGNGLDEVVVLAPTSARRMDHPRSIPARVERRLRRIATRRLLHETELVRAEGSQVRLIVPGPEDLTVMGANLMNPVQRLTVLETSLRTTAAVLRNPSPHRTAKPPASG